jgi:cytochrome b561
MQWRNAQTGYGVVQIVLHWLVALTIFGMLALGLWMTGLDYYDPWYRQGPDLHRAIGILLGLVLILRLAWRLGSPVPRPLTDMDWKRRAAIVVHGLLYLLPFALIASGYLLSTADGRPVDVFGWFEVPASLHGLERQADIAGDVHFFLAMLLIGIALVHIAAAIDHHFLQRDATLTRMLRPRTFQHPHRGAP